ncbi:MAG: hypothetical protein Q9157_008416 [Trypethelium eluteriae]
MLAENAIPNLTHKSKETAISHDKDTMLQRHKLKIHALHPGPNDPVHGDDSAPGAAQLGADVAALEEGHRGQEDGGVGRREDALVAADLRQDLQVRPRREVDPSL